MSLMQPGSSLTSPGDSTLKAEELLLAVDQLCGSSRTAASVLRVVSRKLTAQTENWHNQAKRLQALGLVGRYCAAIRFREVLELPGDLAVVQAGNGRFLLLRYVDQHWHSVGSDGELLPKMPELDAERYVEVVTLRIPLAGMKLDGFASLAGLWQELKSAWAEIGLACLFINAGQLLLPLFSMLVYDKIAHNGLFETMWTLTIGMLLYLLTDLGMRFVRSWSTERIGVDLAQRSDEALWSKLLAQTELPAGGFAKFMTTYRDLAMSRDFVSSNYLLALADLPFLLLYFAVVGVLSLPLMLTGMLLAVCYAIMGAFLHKRAQLLSKQAEQATTRKLTFMGELLNSLDVARTTPGVRAFLRSWRDLTELSAQGDAKRRMAQSHQSMLASGMQTFTTITILVVGVYLIDARLMSTGKLIACNLLTARAMALVASCFGVLTKWQDFQRAAQRMETSLEAVEDRQYVPRPDTAGKLLITAISKQYEGRPPALSQVTLAVEPGERVVLLGSPGAGKTTLLRCIAGLCKPDSGQILVDGLALENISRQDRSHWLAYKAQEPVLFAGTLENNLRLSGGDGDRLSRAIWASGLEEEFKGGRMSLGMVLQERGGNLSGGQRQKVALARAFAQPSRILLLDEPTLGLDPESERLLAERLLQSLDPQTTLLMSTHSGIMIAAAQRVIALNNGQVVADGPREQLVTIR